MSRLRFRRGQARVALALGALGLGSVFGAPSAGLAAVHPSIVVATATATAASCPSGSDRFAIEGVSDGSGRWTFSVVDLRAASDGTLRPPCLIAGHSVLQGTWSPEKGGDVQGPSGDFLYLGPVPASLSPVTTPFTACLHLSDCVSGKASAVRY